MNLIILKTLKPFAVLKTEWPYLHTALSLWRLTRMTNKQTQSKRRNWMLGTLAYLQSVKHLCWAEPWSLWGRPCLWQTNRSVVRVAVCRICDWESSCCQPSSNPRCLTYLVSNRVKLTLLTYSINELVLNQEPRRLPQHSGKRYTNNTMLTVHSMNTQPCCAAPWSRDCAAINSLVYPNNDPLLCLANQAQHLRNSWNQRGV